MSARPKLRAVSVDGHGEVRELDPTVCPHCQVKDDEIEGLQRDILGWTTRYANLKRDKEAEAKASEYWRPAMEVFKAWKKATNHPRCGWTVERFELVERFLRNEKYGREMCLRAVAGIAFDHFQGTRKNGTTIHYDEWERCFKDAGQVERFANCAPRDWRDDPIFAPLLDATITPR